MHPVRGGLRLANVHITALSILQYYSCPVKSKCRNRIIFAKAKPKITVKHTMAIPLKNSYEHISYSFLKADYGIVVDCSIYIVVYETNC